MSYTPSTLLALPLITTGTEDGTWGNVVDNGLTSYLDIAIGGSIAITIDAANVTMTNTAGTNSVTNIATTATSGTTSANTAQYAILKISGTKTAARSLILLGASGRKQYFIDNSAAAGGFALTVKAAASTGVTLVDGEKAIVIWNGTDYVKMAPGITTAGATTDLTAISVPSAGTASAFTLTGGTSTTAATAGGAVTIAGGVGASTGAAGAGGAINLTGGASGSNASGTPSGGAVNITGGTGNTLNSSAVPGAVAITGGTAGVAGQAGGAVTISGASGYSSATAATGGSVSITGGSGGSSVTGTGGNVSITSGNGSGATSGNAGTLTLSTGNAAGSGGAAGKIVLSVPAASGGTSGYVQFTMGGTEHARLLATGAWSFGATGTAYGSTGQVLTSAGNGDPVWSTALVSGTVQNSTSGTSIDFTGIPSWVKRVTIMFNGISTSGTSSYQVQAGAGSVTVSGYNGGCATGATFTSNSTGLIFNSAAAAAEVTYGSMVLTNVTGNTWIASGNVYANAARGYYLSGQIALGGALDRVRITTVGGADTFDLGSINIMYE